MTIHPSLKLYLVAVITAVLAAAFFGPAAYLPIIMYWAGFWFGHKAAQEEQ